MCVRTCSFVTNVLVKIQNVAEGFQAAGRHLSQLKDLAGLLRNQESRIWILSVKHATLTDVLIFSSGLPHNFRCER